MKARTLLALSFVGLMSAVALAQQPAPSPAAAPAPTVAATRAQIVGEFVEAAVRAAGIATIQEPFASQVAGFQGKTVSYLLTLHLEKASYKGLLETMESRVDKQVGSSASSAGSTSLATKGAVPAILGAAVEQGAFERSVTGTTLTFRAKPAGVIKFLQSKGVLDVYGDYRTSSGARFASRFSGAAYFDTSRGSSPGTFTAGADQFSGWSVRCEVVNLRDAALGQYASRWRDLLDKPDYAEKARKLHEALSSWAPFLEWQARTTADVRDKVETPFAKDHDKAAAAKRFQAVLEADLALLEKLPALPGEVESALDAYVAQLTTLEKGIGDIYAFANKGALFTVEFTTTRDPKLPDLYTATGVLEAALGAARKTDLTVNGEASFYESLPQGASHKLKNVAFSAEIAHPVASFLGLRGSTVSVAARYSYLPNDTVAAASGAAAPQGSIGVVQAKLTVPVKGSGVKMPFSVTFANRTEVIKESVVRANFGVTFDLDTLLAASRAGR